VCQMIIQGERGNGVVDSMYGSIPDVVLPSQFFELAGARNWSGEQRLMLAVLADAVNLIGQHRDSNRRQRNEARCWVFAKWFDGPMSFERVCDALGLNAEGLRRRLSALISHSSGTFRRIRVKRAARMRRVTVNRRRLRTRPGSQAQLQSA